MADDLCDDFPGGIEEVVDAGVLFHGVNANPSQREQVRGYTSLHSATSAETKIRLRFGLIKSKDPVWPDQRTGPTIKSDGLNASARSCGFTVPTFPLVPTPQLPLERERSLFFEGRWSNDVKRLTFILGKGRVEWVPSHPLLLFPLPLPSQIRASLHLLTAFCMRERIFRESCNFFEYIGLSGTLILPSFLELGIRTAMPTCGSPGSKVRTGPSLKIGVQRVAGLPAHRTFANGQDCQSEQSFLSSGRSHQAVDYGEHDHEK